MRLADWHTYQDPDQATRTPSGRVCPRPAGLLCEHSPHIWWGVSVEDPSTACRGSTFLRRARPRSDSSRSSRSSKTSAGDLSGIDWVIVGGESGHGARPMDRTGSAIRDRCEARACRFSSSNGAALEEAVGTLVLMV